MTGGGRLGRARSCAPARRWFRGSGGSPGGPSVGDDLGRGGGSDSEVWEGRYPVEAAAGEVAAVDEEAVGSAGGRPERVVAVGCRAEVLVRPLGGEGRRPVV